MAFKIRCENEREAKRAEKIVLAYVARSRFRLQRPTWFEPRRGGRAVLMVTGVRLRKAKPYCGAHPGPCRIDPRFERPHPTGCWLEGLDWIGWNNLLNDALDAAGHGGDAGSVVEIRREGRRRVVYEEYGLPGHPGHVDWRPKGDWPNDYTDCRGRPPVASDYPEGTPGLAVWKRADEAKAARGVLSTIRS